MAKLIDDIASLKALCLSGDIQSVADASQALDSFAEERRKQLIAAIYTGREHIHDQSIIIEKVLGVAQCNHIASHDYARIVYEKSSSIPTYLDALMRCVQNSNADVEDVLLGPR